jgi:hypothetical protein
MNLTAIGSYATWSPRSVGCVGIGFGWAVSWVSKSLGFSSVFWFRTVGLVGVFCLINSGWVVFTCPAGLW